MANVELDNLTDTLQRHLGLQQAQTFSTEDATADGIARLVGHRGNVEPLLSLWRGQEASALIDAFVADEHTPALFELRRVLDAGLVVSRYSDGRAKTLLPLSPSFIVNRRINEVYREQGRSVADGLWGHVEEDVRARIAARTLGWERSHPLAAVLAPLCPREKSVDRATDSSHLARAIDGDARLKKWVATCVQQDWRAWLKMAEKLSVDEQVETMASLVGLHLHVALLHRLLEPGTEVPPFYYATLAGRSADQASARAAHTCYAYWGERAAAALRHVASVAVARALEEDRSLHGTFGSWTQALAWAGLGIKGSRTTRAIGEYQTSLKRRIQEERQRTAVSPQAVSELVIDSLVEAFSTPNGVVTKVKDFLRSTGRSAGIVGPEDRYMRKRYQANERALNLLIRLHAERAPGEIMTEEDERQSIDALLDDAFERYGLLVTVERDRIRTRVAALRQSDVRSLGSLLKLLPGVESMRENRAELDRRLDELRFVRRYSDASAVLRVS